MKKKSLKINALFSVIKTIMSLIFPLITFPYASRILLPEGIGKVNFANSIISYFGIIASLGISTYGIREASKIKNDKQQLSKFVIELFIINLISTIVSYAILYACIICIPKLQEYRLLLFICSLSIFFTTLGLEWLYNTFEEYGYITIRSFVFQIISIILLFLLVKTTNDYTKYACIIVISSVGSNICNFINARKFIDIRNIRKIEIKKHIKPILIFFGSTLAISVFTILDTSMLGFLSTETEVGYYTAATKLIRMIRDLFPAIFTVLFARLSSYANDVKEANNYTDIINNTINFIICFSIPIIVGLLLLGKNIIEILSGISYIKALPTMYIMTPVILFSSLAGFLGGNILLSKGKEKIYLLCVIIGAFINFLLNFLLIPKKGALGAGISTVITEFMLMTVYICLLKNSLDFKSFIIPIIQYVCSSMFMGGILYIIQRYIKSYVLQIIIMPIIGFILYISLLILTKNNFINNIFQMIFSKINKIISIKTKV